MSMSNGSDIFDFISCIFYPNRCVFCDSLLPPSENICEECYDTLPFVKGEICYRCGLKKEECVCKKQGGFYDGIVSVFYYKDSVKNAIRNFKFHGNKYAYRKLAPLMAECFKERYADIHFDCIAYVPMERKRKRKRGYNQSELLAKELSDILKIPCADNLILKIFPTELQHECTELERKGNLLGAFDINKDFDINGKTVLLVDDVKTSGATLNECGKMLFLYGAERVFCLTAAVVDSKIRKKSD